MYKALICVTLTAAAGLALAGSGPGQDGDHGDHGSRHGGMRAEMQARFADADVDGDGSLDRIEATALSDRLGEHFAMIDADGNGELSQDELRQARHHGRGGRGMAYMAGLVQGMDDDGDGNLTRAEIGSKAPMLTEQFAAIDADTNGALSRDELRAHHQAMHGSRHDGDDDGDRAVE